MFHRVTLGKIYIRRHKLHVKLREIGYDQKLSAAVCKILFFCIIKIIFDVCGDETETRANLDEFLEQKEDMLRTVLHNKGGTDEIL